MQKSENRSKKLVSLNEEEKGIIEEMAAKRNITAEEMLSQIVRERTNEHGYLEFEENNITYERTQIDLPKAIVNYYRVQTFAQDKNDHIETLIAIDICNHVKSQVEGMTPEALKDLFNLGPALADMADRESKIFDSKTEF